MKNNAADQPENGFSVGRLQRMGDEILGLLGIALLFVGIALVSNGVCILGKVDGKSMAAMNLITAFVIIAGNLIALSKAASFDVFAHQNVASGFLFGFTYLFIAANNLFKLDLRPFGWFSFFVAVYAAIMCVFSATSADPGHVKFALLWGAWAILWLEGFLELAAGLRIGKIFPYLSIVEGVFAAFIPAVLMLTEKW